jgi:hypothetical protein
MFMSANNGNNFANRRAVQMLLILTLLAYPLLQDLTNFAASAARTMPNVNKAEDAMANTSSIAQNYQTGDIKVLAEGFHSKITKPFVAVVRDAETYAALTALDENLPKLDGDFFKENVAIAAFLGERNTGGYSVEINRCGGRICVDERSPGKSVMVPQVITSPFKLISLPASGIRPFSLDLDGPWRQSMRPYRITSGHFAMSGGFAATTKQFGLEGQVRSIHQDNFVTFAFEIFSHELTENRSLEGFETGLIRSKGEIAILRMTADSLIDSPNSGLKARGAFSEADNTLSLSFVSLPSMIADGYSGMGNIEAKIVVSSPKP